MVVQNRRTWIRECWVCCGIVGLLVVLRVASALGAQEDRFTDTDDCTGPEFPLSCTNAVCEFVS